MFRFPWGDMHSLNLGWFLQKFNELRADWATAEENITGALDAEIQRAEDALSDVFDARDAAAASATAAAGSASSAGTSATAAQNSATAAGNSATLANQKATAAGLSEAAAAQSATAASNSATAAATSATQAGNSASAAQSSAAAAAASEAHVEEIIEDAATEAVADATAAAANSATAAGNSATAAANSESAAAGSAGAAANSATAAANSESAAAGSAADAAQSVLSTIPSTSAIMAGSFLTDFSQTIDGRAYTLQKNKFSSRFASAGQSTRVVNITGTTHVTRGQTTTLNTVTDKYVEDFVPFKIGEASARAALNKIKVNCNKIVDNSYVIKFFACLANIENDVITPVTESAIVLYSATGPADSELILSNIEADYIALYILTTNAGARFDAYIDMERVNPSAALGTTLIRPGLDLTVEPETDETI